MVLAICSTVGCHVQHREREIHRDRKTDRVGNTSRGVALYVRLQAQRKDEIVEGK